MSRKAPSGVFLELDQNYYLELITTKFDNFSNNSSVIYLEKTMQAFNKLEQQERILLYEKYLDKEKKDNIYIYCSQSMSESTFYRKLRTALIHFGECLDSNRHL